MLHITSYTPLAPGFKNPIKQVGYAIKARLKTLHERSLPRPYSDLLIGLVFGQHGTKLPDAWTDNFQKTGLTHLLVVSGSQVALLSGICFNLLFKFPMGIRVLLIGIINSVFYIMTGGGASIFRAIIMMMLTLCLRWASHRTTPMHIMGVTLGIMGLINPLSWFQTGAQLSFLATMSLVFGVPKVASFFPNTRPFIAQLIGLTLAPFLFTSALLWYIFGQISVGSLLTNLLVGFWIEWLVVIGFFSTIIGMILPVITDWINYGCLGMMMLLTGLVNTVSQWPGMVISLGKPALLVPIIAYLVMAYGISRPVIWRMTTTLALISFCFGLWFPSLWLTHPLRVFFLDVGQGDSILIQTPNNHTILIDTGPPGSGRYVIGPSLRYLGITAIDRVILTHPHADHTGGFKTLARQFSIGTVLHDQNRDYYQVYAFNDGVQLRVIYPPRTDENINNVSVSALLTYGDIRFAFTGDLERAGERKLIERYGDTLQATVLKLGHHGSQTSSIPDFLDTVRPAIAVATVGERNRYRHPSPEPVAACAARGIKLYRTDHHGTVAFRTDGTDLYSRTWK